MLGLIGNTIYQMCFIVGLSLTTVSNSALVLASMPAMVAGLAFAFRLERVTARAAEGLALDRLASCSSSRRGACRSAPAPSRATS